MPDATVRSDTMKEYLAVDAVSNSRITDFRKSRRLYEAYYVTKTVVPPKATDDMDVGTATHTLVLQPLAFNGTVSTAGRDVLNKAGGRSGAVWEEFNKQNAHKIILTEDMRKRVLGMRYAVLNHPAAGQLVVDATAVEQSIYWTCPNTGLGLKCRIDLVTASLQSTTAGPLICDLKTTADHTTKAFLKSCIHWGYHRQNRLYMDGWRASGGNPSGFVFIVVSNHPPHVCQCYEIGWRAVELTAKSQLSRAIRSIAECYENDDWSEPGEGSVTMLEYDKWDLEEQ